MFWKYEDNKLVNRKPPTIPSSGRSFPKEVLDAMQQVKIMRKIRDERNSHKEEVFSSSDEAGAEERFKERTNDFKAKSKPIYKHHAWWFIHNCIAHPLIGIFPSKSTFEFHDWTSRKINGR